MNPIKALEAYLGPSEVLSFIDCAEFQGGWSCHLSVRGIRVRVSDRPTKTLVMEDAARNMLKLLLRRDELHRIEDTRPNVTDKRAMIKWHLDELQNLLAVAKFE